MLLVSSLGRLAPAALLMVVSCTVPPSPDASNLHGSVRLEAIQDHALYPHAIVEEFKQFNHKLDVTKSKTLETAVVARVQWDITAFEPRCEVAIALRHTAQWYNYAWAGDGALINGTSNWWGLAQAKHPELKDPPLVANPPFLLDVFWTGQPVASGRALIAWYVNGSFDPHLLSTVRAYVAYGCRDTNRFAVTTVEVTAEAFAVVSPSALGNRSS